MAFDTVILQHPITNQIKQAPVGFSWTMFFFGFFPPMFRGDWKWFGIILGLTILFGIATLGIGGWLVGVIGAFIWNKSYLNNLIGKGFQVSNVQSGNFDRVNAILGYQAPRLASSLTTSAFA